MHPIHGVQCWAFATVMLASGCNPIDDHNKKEDRDIPDIDVSTSKFILEKEHSIRLAPGSLLAGAKIQSDGSVLAWGRNSSYLVRFSPTGSADTVLLPSSMSVESAYMTGAGVYEILDANNRTVSTVRGVERKIMSSCSIPIVSIWNGTRSLEGRWYVAGFDSLGVPQVAVSQLDFCKSWNIRSFGPGKIGSLSTSSRGVWLAYREPAQGMELLDLDGNMVKEDVPNSSDLSLMRITTDTSESWVGMQSFFVGAGTLQVVADIKSERRKLILRDKLGRVRRITELNAMWSIVDGDEVNKRLAAVHEADGTEILLYRWRWQESDSSQSP